MSHPGQLDAGAPAGTWPGSATVQLGRAWASAAWYVPRGHHEQPPAASAYDPRPQQGPPAAQAAAAS